MYRSIKEDEKFAKALAKSCTQLTNVVRSKSVWLRNRLTDRGREDLIK